MSAVLGNFINDLSHLSVTNKCYFHYFYTNLFVVYEQKQKH